MKTKRWIRAVVVIGVSGIPLLWIFGLLQTTGPGLPSFYAIAAVPAPQSDQKKVVLKNLGMSCKFCRAAISAKLKNLPGVIAYDVDLKSDSATVLYDPVKVDIEKLKRTIAEAGFQVRAVEEIDR